MFCAVADAGTYSGAAKMLGVEGDHIPLIRSLTRLKEVTGGEALVKGSPDGSVTLTPRGIELIPAARAMLAAGGELTREVLRVRFSSYPTIAARVVASCSSLMLADIPLYLDGVSESSRSDRGAQLLTRVLRRDLDLVIAPDVPDSSVIAGLKRRQLYEWRLCVATSDATLMQRKRVGPRDLLTSLIGAAPPGHGSYELAKRAFEDAHIPFELSLESNSPEVLASVAKQDPAFACIIPSDAFVESADSTWPTLRSGARSLGGAYALYARSEMFEKPKHARSPHEVATVDAFKAIQRSFAGAGGQTKRR